MIVSSGNPKVKDMRAARRCKDDLALLEGPHLVGEAIAADLELQTVVATPAYLEEAEAQALVERLPRPPLAIAPEILDELLDSDSPRGIAATLHLPHHDLTALPVSGVSIYADGIQDPGNLGAIARSAEGSGVGTLLLGPGCSHPNHPRALRASAGSLLRIPRIAVRSPDDLPSDRGLWIGLDGAASTSVYDFEIPESLILAVGSEAHGLSPALRNRVETLLSIPLDGRLESLNAAVATAVTLFEIRRRRNRGV